MSWTDAQGIEHKAVIAEKDAVVHDDNLGFDRQILAGQPVPPELTQAYKEQHGPKDQEAKDAVAGDEETKVAQGRKSPSSKPAVGDSPSE
jgi:hypothetical protein